MKDFGYYATEPRAMELLLRYEYFSENVWECSCREGNLRDVLKEWGYNVYSMDEHLNFMNSKIKFNGDIITIPPTKNTTEFIKKALHSIPMGNKVAMLLKINYLSSQQLFREIYSKLPPYRVYVFTGIECAWLIWEKGMLCPTELRWLKS